MSHHDPVNYLTFGMYALGVTVMMVVMVGLSALLGTRRKGASDPYPFESGIMPVHDMNIRFPSQFYIIAMLFVIFDLELIFVFAWAVVAREVGWRGYGAIMSFLFLLIIALAYLWRSGALVWSTPAERARLRRGTQ